MAIRYIDKGSGNIMLAKGSGNIMLTKGSGNIMLTKGSGQWPHNVDKENGHVAGRKS
jgi:hypothetical protein